MSSGKKVKSSSKEHVFEDETYYVHKVMDIKEGKDGKLFRIRWLGYDPTDDSWEPISCFSEASRQLAVDFLARFERMKKEYVASACAQGREITLQHVNNVNILSEHIEHICNIRGKADNPLDCYYEVKWVGESELSWVIGRDLLNAQDKLEEFMVKHKLIRLQKKFEAAVQAIDLERLRRIKEREIRKSKERGKTSDKKDHGSKIKGRKSSSNLISSPKPSTSKEKKKRIRVLTIDSDSSDSENQEQQSSHKSSSEDSKNNNNPKFLEGLPRFDPVKSEKEFDRLSKLTVQLSKDEFETAVEKNDYPTLLASLGSDSIPEVDFTKLFLEAARKGGRDVALLLATRVRNLETKDSYGETAICMAAKLGDICFAHYLFNFGVWDSSSPEITGKLYENASKFGHGHFVKFLNKYLGRQEE